MSSNTLQNAFAQAQAEIEKAHKQAVAKQAAQDAAAAKAAAKQLAESERMQAMVDATYLVAAADGTLSGGERDKVLSGLGKMFGGKLDATALAAMLDKAKSRCDKDGVAGVAEKAAAEIQGDELRRSVFLIAASTSWLDGGIGTKEGLALQAISKAFGIPMNEMHQLLGQAKG